MTTDSLTANPIPIASKIPNCDELIIKLAEIMAIYIDERNHLENKSDKESDAFKAQVDPIIDYLDAGIGGLDSAILNLPATGNKALAIQARSASCMITDEKTRQGRAMMYIVERLEKQADLKREEYGGHYWAGKKKSACALMSEVVA